MIYADNYETGYERAVAFARELRRVNESASRSFCERLEEVRGYKNIDELYKLSSRLVKAKKRLKHIFLEPDFARRAA